MLMIVTIIETLLFLTWNNQNTPKNMKMMMAKKIYPCIGATIENHNYCISAINPQIILLSIEVHVHAYVWGIKNCILALRDFRSP